MVGTREQSIVLERELPGDTARVWESFASADGLRTWWWTQWDDVRIEADVRVGGRYRISVPRYGIDLSGEYLRVEPGRALEQTWEWSDDGAAPTPGERVRIRLTPAGRRTRLTVEHRGPWTGDEQPQAYRDGWNSTLDLLEGVLARG